VHGENVKIENNIKRQKIFMYEIANLKAAKYMGFRVTYCRPIALTLGTANT